MLMKQLISLMHLLLTVMTFKLWTPSGSPINKMLLPTLVAS
jgi:hypothetical protein